MYSNDKRNGFSILDLMVKIIFACLFIFILVWLFQKKVPNMTPFYSNVFRENIKYMQEAGESYFTDEKMPTEIGNEVKITLNDMISRKLIIPFVDEDGNSCNLYESYVSVTKTDTGYDLKTNLVCNKESDYTIKVLGCHTYCKDKECTKTCSIEKITKYQFKKLVTGTKTKYSCDSGYTLKGKYCYKTVLDSTRSAEVKKTNTRTITKDAKKVIESGKKELLTTRTETKYDEVKPIPASTKTVKETYTYDCSTTKTERKCSTTYTTESYSCNCSTHTINHKQVVVCDTCTNSIPVETCEDVETKVPKTCTGTRDKVVTVPASCPSGTDKQTGSGATLKCYKSRTIYLCPSNSNYSEGSGKDLKCYKVTNGSFHYECEDKTYTLNGDKCTKTINEETIEYSCDSGYKLEGTVCKKYKTDKVRAKSKKITTKYYKYTWSEKETLSGWTRTGKTKTVNGKEKCE